MPNTKRDNLLDFYKGIAITIVVLGHTYQSIFYPDTFATELGYRFIGAMQMPFFVFLSGVTAAIWIGSYDLSRPLQETTKWMMRRVKASAFRLLLPFCSWALIAFLLNHRSETTFPALWSAFQSQFRLIFHDPMYALWFLLCIFYCILAWCLIQMGLAISIALIKPVNHFWKTCSPKAQVLAQVLCSLFLWFLFRKINPRIFGSWFLDDYFFYFILGIAFHAALQKNEDRLNPFAEKLFSLKLSWLFYIAFLMLAPFWALTADNNLEPYAFDYHGKSYVNALYRFIVATSGIYVALDISRKIYFLNRVSLNQGFAYLGKMSLGIYALHTYFLHIYPPVLAPLLLSVGMSFIILQIPLLRGMLLGEKRRG